MKEYGGNCYDYLQKEIIDSIRGSATINICDTAVYTLKYPEYPAHWSLKYGNTFEIVGNADSVNSVRVRAKKMTSLSSDTLIADFGNGTYPSKFAIKLNPVPNNTCGSHTPYINAKWKFSGNDGGGWDTLSYLGLCLPVKKQKILQYQNGGEWWYDSDLTHVFNKLKWGIANGVDGKVLYMRWDGEENRTMLETKITFAKNDNYAFANCTNMIELRNNAINPQNISHNVFEGVPDLDSVKLYVSAKTETEYRNNDEWKRFYIYIRVKGVKITGNKIFNGNNTELNLMAVFKPDNATNKSLTWASSNEAILRVNQDGRVSRVSKCDNIEVVTVTATAADDRKASHIIKVMPDVRESACKLLQ